VVDKKEILDLIHSQFPSIHGNYIQITDDGTVNVKGNMNAEEIPGVDRLQVRFGEVTGYFNISRCELTTLEGCPEVVGSHFTCRDNLLTNLKHGPKKVGGIYGATDNALTSLEGLAEQIGGSVELHYQKNLPLLRTLVAAGGCILRGSLTELRAEDILNDERWMGKGKQKAMLCAAALIKAGYKENAKW
jgi:hypothetical protein